MATETQTATASLTLTNKATGQAVTVPIDPTHNVVVAAHIKPLLVTPENPPPASEADKVGLMFYDAGFTNTVACRSKISEVGGQTGGLTYRGYAIEDLTAHASFTEVAYLLIYGELPNRAQFDKWQRQLLRHTYLHRELERQLQTFRWDSHPMGMLIAGLASLSTFHPEANPALVGDALYVSGPREQYLEYYKVGTLQSAAPSPAEVRDYVRTKQVYRILGKLPTIAANVYRHREGRPYNHPMPNPRSYTENFLYMIDRLNEDDYVPDPELVAVLDKAFILLAEHGSSCSTIAMRHLISSGVDPFTALSGACGTLFGERKASEVVRMLEEIGSVEKIDAYLTAVKRKKSIVPTVSRATTAVPTFESPRGIPAPSGPTLLQGFGHRVVKGTDPRVKLMKDLTLQTFKHIHGADPYSPSNHLVYLALELESRALADEYFASRKLGVNIDYWTAILLHTFGFPKDMFAVLLAIPRSVGYLAHALESVDDKEYKIFRPRQVYHGDTLRAYVPLHERATGDAESVHDALAAVSVRSNPAAQLRRSLNEATTLREVNALIEQTRASITQITQDLSGALEATGGDRAVSPPSPAPAGSASPPGSNRPTPRLLRRLLSTLQRPAQPAAAAIPEPASPTGSARNLMPEEQVSQLENLPERLNASQAELRELLDVQRELLKMQANLKAGQHISDSVDLAAFERLK
ncbi:hypothetical protein H9P43_007317 [Blastocladiella emersonii ATCC 22665]|nr:hypothetical protein H9P43_007317 [Blastocladiella emersonii ATCC 22665]